MPLTATDMTVLRTVAEYYVLTREQIQLICFPDHRSGRCTRERLSRLHSASYLSRHRVPVALPDTKGAAPVYYPTKDGAEALASYYDDERYLATNTRGPRADRLCHWISINSTRLVIEQAIARQNRVGLDRWLLEWETINKDAAPHEQFCLHTQLSQTPPLSCSPDAAFILSALGHKKVFYLEQDLGTSSPRQIAARKSKGYAELAARQYHRIHFPETTLTTFSVLMVTTNGYRCQATGREMSRRDLPELWLFMNQKELAPDSFLHGPITYNHKGEPGPLVELPAESEVPESRSA